MKILIVSPIFPKEHNIRIDYVNSVVDSLKEKTHIEVYWLIVQPDIITENNIPEGTILDLHKFSDGVDLIKKIKPDVYLANPTLEPINYSISLASMFFNIPIVCFEHSFFDFSNQKNVKANKFSLLFSDQLPTDTESQSYLLRRFRFSLFKFSFLLKTRLSLKKDFNQLISLFKDTFNYFSGKLVKINPFGNLYLISSERSIKTSNLKIIENKNSVIVVGNPYWDKLSSKIRNKNNSSISKIPKLLIVTNSLYEHGYWNKSQREKFLKSLFSVLSQNNFSFALKIHPSSEDKAFYESFLKKLNIQAEVFQDQYLWDIAYDYDVLISYGHSQAITEIAYSGHKLIFLDAGIPIPKAILLKNAVDEGNAIECNFENLSIKINEILKLSGKISEKFQNSCDSIFPKIDGKSSDKIANILLDL